MAHAAGQEAVQPSRTEQRSIQVTVSWWAPLQIRRFRPGNRLHGFGVHLGHVSLEKLELIRVAQFRITCEERPCVRLGAATVHQQKRERLRCLASEMKNLSDNEVEEGIGLFDREQGFGFRKAHSCAQTAIELDDDNLA